MRAEKLINLIGVGAQDTARQYLKRLSLKERLPVLHQCIPYVTSSGESLQFFQKNFAQEIGALIAAKYDYERAERLYNSAKGMG